MKAIFNGKIVLPDHIEDQKALLFDRKIIGVVPADQIPENAERIDAEGNYVIPGLVDMHIHGYLGEDALMPFAALYIRCIMLFSCKYSSPLSVIRISSASIISSFVMPD